MSTQKGEEGRNMSVNINLFICLLLFVKNGHFTSHVSHEILLQINKLSDCNVQQKKGRKRGGTELSE
jgi:hypothetical protein